MGSDGLGSGGGLPRLPGIIIGNVLERHRDRGWREKKKTEKNRRDSGESKQVHLELEQNEGMGPGPEVGSGSKGCWRRQAGWVPPVAAETQERPAWSVAEEDPIF